MKKMILSVLLLAGTYTINAQGVAINDNGVAADASAALDVTSTSKGVLIPRVTTTERDAIASPATGLLIFDTTLNGFYYYDGTEWANTAEDGDVTLTNENVVSGIDAGASLGNNGATPGAASIAIGWNALTLFRGNPSGNGNSFNVAVGWNSQSSQEELGMTGFLIDQNFANTSVGGRTLEDNNGGGFLNAFGYQALQKNTSGSGNAAFGAFALNRNVDGEGNVGMGLRAGQENTTGSNNVFLGDDAGRGIQTNPFGGNAGADENNNSTFLGAETGNADTSIDHTNSTAIGYQALIDADNQIVLGNSSVTDVKTSGTITAAGFNQPSDKRFKYNISEEVGGLDFILNLRPVVYNFDYNKHAKFKNMYTTTNTDKIETGFIAQEVEAASLEAGYDFDGVNIPKNMETDHYTVNYAKFVVPLTKAVQELSALVEAQKNLISALQEDVAELKGSQTEIAKNEK